MKEKIINSLKGVNEFIDWEKENEILTKGVIDSIELLELITELEELFGIEIDIDEISPDNFDSIDSIVEMLKRLSAGKEV